MAVKEHEVNELGPESRDNWIISAIVFAVADLLIEHPGPQDYFANGHMIYGAVVTDAFLLSGISGYVISFAFIGSGLAALRGHSLGLSVLKITAAWAAIRTVIEPICEYFVVTSPAFKIIWNKAVTTVRGYFPDLTAQMLNQAVHTSIPILMVGVVLIIICQVAYYACLYREMAKLAIRQK